MSKYVKLQVRFGAKHQHELRDVVEQAIEVVENAYPHVISDASVFTRTDDSALSCTVTFYGIDAEDYDRAISEYLDGFGG